MKGDTLTALLHEWGAILFGLAIGALAYFGRKLSVGDRPNGRQVAGYLMQLGIIGLVASVGTRLAGVANQDMRALATALLALAAQEVVQYLKRNGWGPIAKAAVSAVAMVFGALVAHDMAEDAPVAAPAAAAPPDPLTTATLEGNAP